MEVVAPVTARSARERLWEILDVSLKDQRQAWLMDSDGGYTQLRPDPQLDASDSLGTHETLDRPDQASTHAMRLVPFLLTRSMV